MKFTKLEGCGNDFVVVDLRDGGGVSPAEAAILCDRRFGVGGDGVLTIERPARSDAHARMRVLNADGSEAEMCGNGIRCVAKYLYERGLDEPRLAIETGAGVLACGLTIRDGKVDQVSVSMGPARVRRGEIPMIGPAGERALEQEIEIVGRRFRVSGVSMGNPHAVVFVDGEEPLRDLAERYGPPLERHPWFPQKTNAEFARPRASGEIDLVVWERGCGITLACGTGASATAAAACLTGRAELGREIPVHLLGGTLHITVAEDLSNVLMRGPADEVFAGEVDVAALTRRRG